jgi:hypothetical protein
MIGTLLALVIGIVLVLTFASGGFGGAGAPQRKDGQGRTVIGRSRLAAEDAKCREHLGQVRLAIQVYGSATADDAKPESLRDLKLPAEMLACPVGNEPYAYDPTSGVARCPHPGHEKY